MTDAEQPATTVVIPVWDAYTGERLVAAVASVAEQDRSAQIVLVDNASSAQLPALRDVEVLRLPERLSLGAARNRGLAAVATANVMFWDADDLMLPGTLGFLEDQLAANPGLVAFGAAIVEDPSGSRHRWPRRWIVDVIPHRRAFALLDSVWSMFPTTGATLMRTELVRSCGGFGDANSGEDWSLGAALLWRGPAGWSERPGRRYLQHEGSAWSLFGSPRHQLVNARAVRHRLAQDGGVPPWAKAMLPVVAVLQISAVAAHAGVARIKAAARRRHVSGAT